MLYLDTSALAKLLTREPETGPLRELLSAHSPGDVVSSALVRAELARVAQRLGGSAPEAARRLVDACAQVTLTEGLLDRAGALPPAGLRSLDAIHVATALELADDLRAFVAYDTRLLDAARRHGLPVATPS